MSIDLFKPEIWSARLLRHLDRKLIYAQPQVCNRDWEGEIAEAGDTVHIQKVGNPTILDYEPGKDMPAPERPHGETLTLVVDQFKAFNVALDDVDKAQVNVALLDEFAERAGVGLAKVIDSYVAAQQVLAVPSVNQIGTDGAPISVKADGSGDMTPYEMAVELARLLADQEAPEDDLWMGINPALEAEIRLDDKFIGADAGRGDQSVVRNGHIGTIAGFEVLRTTGTPKTVNATKILAGAGNYATTFAHQLTKIEAFRIEAQFGDGVKGLEVYGAKVVEPETIALANVEGGTGS